VRRPCRFLPWGGEPIMFKIELYKHAPGGEPTATFATDAEIAIADQLRRQLEERYLAQSAPSSPSQERSGEGH